MRQQCILTITAEPIDLLRHARVIWAHTELGAPFVELVPADSTISDVNQTVRQLLNRPSLPDADALTIYRDALRSVPVFAQFGRLNPGRYTIRNRFGSEEISEQPFLGERLALVEGDQIGVDVSAESLSLIRGAKVVVGDDGGKDIFVGVDPKYPYGSDSHFYNDMAKILGWAPSGPREDDDDPDSLRELSQAQIDALDRLHYLSQPVLQALLEKGDLPLGTYKQDPPGWGRWRPVVTNERG